MPATKLLPYFLIAGYTGSIALGKAPIPNADDQWPMAAGPTRTGTTSTTNKVPTAWSGSNDVNIAWRTVLPEAGLSGIAVWDDRVFLTTNKPLPEGTSPENAKGTDIIGYCLDANDGNILWTVDIPSAKETAYSSLFTDNSSATPVTDGLHVWFINHGGMMACYDMQGHEIWKRPFVARTRHNAKQSQPILVDGQLLYVMMREENDPLAKPMIAEPGDRNSPAKDWPWTYIRAFDAASGNPLWVEPSGTSVHNTPRLGYIDGKPFVFHARGGGHLPPETPYGFSMSSAGGHDSGECLWTHDTKNPFAYTVSQFDEKHAYGIENGTLLKFDSQSGKVLKKFPLFAKADIHLWNSKVSKYESHPNSPFSIVTKKFKPIPTNNTPILVGEYFLFLTHEGHCIGRVNTENGKVEYLQAPVQAVRSPGKIDEYLWESHIKPKANNSRGMLTASDPRSEGDGWGHVTAGAPFAVNEYVFFSTMLGMTYVVDSTAEVFDESALVSINDLGSSGETWSLSSPTYAQGKIFHRGLKEIVCIKAAE
ncbi:MAG: PQQ-binding-like beta-propeller repeat protein [Luteolibacter sp.]